MGINGHSHHAGGSGTMTLAHNQMHVNYIVLKSSAACDSYSAICMADEATDSMWQDLGRQNTQKNTQHNKTKQKLLPLCSCSFQHRSWYTVAQILWLTCSIAPGQHKRTTNLFIGISVATPAIDYLGRKTSPCCPLCSQASMWHDGIGRRTTGAACRCHAARCLCRRR